MRQRLAVRLLRVRQAPSSKADSTYFKELKIVGQREVLSSYASTCRKLFMLAGVNSHTVPLTYMPNPFCRYDLNSHILFPTSLSSWQLTARTIRQTMSSNISRSTKPCTLLPILIIFIRKSIKQIFLCIIITMSEIGHRRELVNVVSAAQHDLALIETVVIYVGLVVHHPLVSSVRIDQINRLGLLFLDLNEVCVFLEGWVCRVLADLFPHRRPNGCHDGGASVVDKDVAHFVSLEGVNSVIDEETGIPIATIPVDLSNQQPPQVLVASNRIFHLRTGHSPSDSCQGDRNNSNHKLPIHVDNNKYSIRGMIFQGCFWCSEVGSILHQSDQYEPVDALLSSCFQGWTSPLACSSGC